MHDEEDFTKYITDRLAREIAADYDKEFRKMLYGDFSNMGNYGTSAISQEQQKINALEKELDKTKHQLNDARHELMAFRLDQTSEKLLREQHPGLKDAWEQYQTILDLVKDY